MPTYLADILASHRARAEADGRLLSDLVEQAESTAPPRDFAGALRGDGLACIAEIKRRSPSKGDLDPGLQADLVAKEYAAGGAACLSVLTDAAFFGGSAADLAAARQASGLPVLRKDFTVQEADVADARLMGADAVLLIVAALDDDELQACAARADQLGLAALVEVHDEDGARRAPWRPARAWSGSTSATCAPSRSTTSGRARWPRRIPPGVVAVAESGIRDADDARRLAEAGYDAILVGETLVRADGPSGTAAGPGRASRRSPMSDGLFVKICGITSEADALLSVSLGATAVGFIFAPSPRQVSVQLAGRHRQATARARADRRRLPRRGAAA